MKTMKKKMLTKKENNETKDFWQFVREASRKVAKWPAWKRNAMPESDRFR